MKKVVLELRQEGESVTFTRYRSPELPESRWLSVVDDHYGQEIDVPFSEENRKKLVEFLR